MWRTFIYFSTTVFIKSVTWLDAGYSPIWWEAISLNKSFYKFSHYLCYRHFLSKNSYINIFFKCFRSLTDFYNIWRRIQQAALILGNYELVEGLKITGVWVWGVCSVSLIHTDKPAPRLFIAISSLHCLSTYDLDLDPRPDCTIGVISL